MLLDQFHMFAESSSGIGALGLNLQAFIIQLLTFLIVFLALKKWAFKPIIKLLDERHKVIESGITLGEKMRIEKEELEKSISTELHKARREADKIMADAQSGARETVHEAEEAARARADGIIKDAKEQIAIATQSERKKLEKEIMVLVSEVSEAVIGEKVDAHKDAGLIDKALKDRQTV